MWNTLPVEIKCNVASLLPANETAWNLRVLNASSRSALNNYDVIKLDQPMPQDALMWLLENEFSPFHDFNEEDRKKALVHITSSGDLPNLKYAVQKLGFLNAEAEILNVAAGKGYIHSCIWLNSEITLTPDLIAGALKSAASEGCLEICQIYVNKLDLTSHSGLESLWEAVFEAAKKRHNQVMKTMIEKIPRPPYNNMMNFAAIMVLIQHSVQPGHDAGRDVQQ